MGVTEPQRDLIEAYRRFTQAGDVLRLRLPTGEDVQEYLEARIAHQEAIAAAERAAGIDPR